MSDLNELGLKLNFFASQAAEVFYCARTGFPADALSTWQVQAIVYYRRPFRKREAAFSFVAYQWSSDAVHAEVARSLDDVLAYLRGLGYNGEPWRELPYETYGQHIAPIDDGPLWNAGYGVTREKGEFGKHRFLPEDTVLKLDEPF